jgi:hypothetical protein
MSTSISNRPARMIARQERATSLCLVRSARGTIHVKRKPPIVKEILVTPRGPITSPALDGDLGAISTHATWMDPRPARGVLALHFGQMPHTANPAAGPMATRRGDHHPPVQETDRADRPIHAEAGANALRLTCPVPRPQCSSPCAPSLRWYTCAWPIARCATQCADNCSVGALCRRYPTGCEAPYAVSSSLAVAIWIGQVVQHPGGKHDQIGNRLWPR